MYLNFNLWYAEVGSLFRLIRMKRTFKKFIKLFFNPIKFFKDSWLFKSNFLDDGKKIKNLFVISHLGQLAQVESLIKKEGLLNCALVILYTKKNKKMPELTKKNTNKSLFKCIYLLEIPTYPNRIEIKKLVRMNNSYQKMIDKIKPNKLFVFSFEKHYGLLLSYAEKKNISINLIEEGTATYKYDNVDEANRKIYSTLSRKEKFKAMWIKLLPMLKELRPTLSIYNRFHTVYCMESKVLEKVFIAKKYTHFFLYEDIKPDSITLDIQNKYQISNQDIIFLNQRYPFPADIYAMNLINILKTQKPVNGKVFLKLHPKDTDEFKLALKNEISQQRFSEHFILIEESDFLVEKLIHLSMPKQTMALTSTGLVYSYKISEETESVSIYPKLRKKMLESVPYSEAIFKEADEHFNILQKFPGISFLE